MPDVQGAPQVTGSGFTPVMGNFSNYGFMTNPMLMDPQYQQAMMRQQYAQSLLSQGGETTPLRSPWQAAARVLQGALGGYYMGQSADMLQQYAEGSRKELANQYANTPILNYPPAPPLGGGGGGAAPARVTANTPGAVDPASLVPMDQARTMIAQRESGNQNVFSKIPLTPDQVKAGLTKESQGSGYYQFIPSTWQEGQNLAGIPPAQQTKLAIDAPKPIQDQVFNAVYQQHGVAPWRASAATNYVTPGSTLGMGTTDIAALRTASDQAQNYGISLAQQYRQKAIDAAQSPYAAVRAMAPQWQQQSLSFAEYGRYTPVGTNSDGQMLMMDRQNGKVDAIGAPVQLHEAPQGLTTTGGDVAIPSDITTLTTLGQKPWNQMTPQEQAIYAGAYTRVGKPNPRFVEGQGITYEPSPNLPPNITVPPGAMPGATPGQAPGARPAPTAPAPPAVPGATAPSQAPGVPGAPTAPPPAAVPVTPPISGTGAAAGQPVADPAAVRAGQNQIDIDQRNAADLRGQAQEVQSTRMMTDQIRSLIASGKIQTGALAPLALEASRIAQGLGFDPDRLRGITGVDPATGELLNKFFTNFSTQATRAMGAHEAGSVVSLFQQNYPSIQSRPPTIDEFTRAIDLQNQFTQKRSELAQQWVDMHRGQPAGYQAINSQAFNDWAKQQGLDPRVYASAALMASGQKQNVWNNGLSRGKTGHAEADQAARLAWGMYPGIGIYGPDGKQHFGPGQ